MWYGTGPKFIAPDLCDDENGETKYSVQSFLLSPEELQLLKPMHIWTNAAALAANGSGGGEQAFDMNMFNQLSEAGIVVGGSRVDVANVNIDELLQSTINEQIIWKFAAALGGIDAKEPIVAILKDLFAHIKSLIGLAEQSPRDVFNRAMNVLNATVNYNDGDCCDASKSNGTQNGCVDGANADAVNHQSVDRHLMDIISRTVVDCINFHVNGTKLHENGRQKYTAHPMLYEIISKALAKNLNLYLKANLIEANTLNGTVEQCFDAIQRILGSPEAMQQIEKLVTLLAVKCMQANKVDLIKAMINGLADKQNDATATAAATVQLAERSQMQPHTQMPNETDILENICVLLGNETIDELHESVRNLICDEPTMIQYILTELQKHNDGLSNEHTIGETVRKCIVAAVQKLANDDIKRIVTASEPQTEEILNTYLTDTIQLARALGFTECILNMSNIINGQGAMIDQIEANEKTFELLQRIIVMHKLAKNDATREKALELLRHDPYTARGDHVLRELLRCSGICTINVEDGKKMCDSNDVPISLIYSQNQLAIEEFFLRTQQKPRGAILIVKNQFQAVVPRESSRDVLTGKISYTVLDESGIRHFEPLHMFTALKLQNVTMFEDRFASYTTENNGQEKLNANDFDIDVDHILNMGAITTASMNGFIAYKSTTMLPTRKDIAMFTKRRPSATTNGFIFDRNQVNYRRSFYL